MGIYDRQYYRDDSPVRYGLGGSARTAVTTLIILNVAVFIIDAFGPNGGGWLMNALGLASELFRRPWNVWQLATYGFAHSPINDPERPGIWHLFFNMLVLFVFGIPVEQKYGKPEFIRFYLFASVFAGFVWVVSETLLGHHSLLVGASGAVSAVVILMALNFPYREVLLLGIIPVQCWLLGVIYVALDLVGSVSQADKVAYVAHLGGAAFAAAYFLLHWNFSGLARFKTLLRRRSRLRLHQPTADERFQTEADRVLEKIHRSGERSLTRGERKILERYSQQMRDRRKSES